MNIREFSKLIEKYNRGECSAREKEMLENYLESFQNNPGNWIDSEMGDKKITEEKIYSQILKEINKEKAPYIYRIIYSTTLLKRAASIVFFLILVTGILYVAGIIPPIDGPAAWNEKVTLTGDKSVIVLSDGSKVILNADSKLKYPEEFDGSKREVYLDGEGYFEVYHNVDEPFIVHTGHLTTTVLGTRFDVSAYPEMNTIAVSLLEGKVRVSSSQKRSNNKDVVLKPREKLIYNKTTDNSSFEMFDSLEAVGWKDNIYKFENEPLGEVLTRLERAYNVKFRINDKSVLAQRITTKFERSSLETVIEVIRSLTGLDYKIVRTNHNKKEILFLGKN